MKVLAIIPARSGSKSIAHKNIKSLFGKPLMAYSIEHALSARLVNRVFVSTDDAYYAELAKSFGAEAPFLRPEEISGDHSNDLEFFLHALEWLETNENYKPDICVHLRPTHPVRDSSDIDNMIRILLDDPEADSVRSVIENKTIIPYKMWFKDENNKLSPIMNIEGVKEPYNTPRQLLPKTYFQNASIDVIRTECILNKRSLSGDRILGYLMEEQFDIDYIEDFERTEEYLFNKLIDGQDISGKKFCFDIDGVIATLTPNNDYSAARVISETVEIINDLYDKGNKIILFTARGTETGIDWKEVTENQMKEWGVKYHELKFGKSGADYVVDDRAINISKLKKVKTI